MHPRFLPAPPDLQPWLEAAVVVHSPAELAQSRFPAMVSSMLVVRLAGGVTCAGMPVPQAAWISPSTLPTVYDHQGAVHAVGLVLRPETAAALWGDGARGRANTICPLAQLACGGETARLGSAAAQAVLALPDASSGNNINSSNHSNTDPNDIARVAVLCQFIRDLVALAPSACEARRLQALALLQAALGTGPQGTPLSTRQWERRFAQHFGMSPKQFAVIARLGTALQHAAAAPSRPGADLAADQGYYDQSHMARDVRRLAGQPLQALVRGASDGAASPHWPLHIGAQTLQSQAGACGSRSEPIR